MKVKNKDDNPGLVLNIIPATQGLRQEDCKSRPDRAAVCVQGQARKLSGALFKIKTEKKKRETEIESVVVCWPA